MQADYVKRHIMNRTVSIFTALWTLIWLGQSHGQSESINGALGISAFFEASSGKRIVQRYGDTNGFGSSERGYNIESSFPLNVVVPFDSIALFAGPYRGYGTTIVLALGCHLHVVVVGNYNSKIERGQFVSRGTLIGVASKTSNTADHKYLYYLEFRKKDTAISENDFFEVMKTDAADKNCITFQRPKPIIRDKVVTPNSEPPKQRLQKPANTPAFQSPIRGRAVSSAIAADDGVNYFVGEGTEIVSVSDGVVAYAGSDIKGYDYLIVLRHDNNYVTIYAQNKLLKVKRGDVVKTGQTIAIAGETANSIVPKLHFQIRKESTPLDPFDYLE